ncbi:hypothetical protein EGW08_000549 [Elysia chlorotica]|uniref:DNA (cytosine-5)-methyltransferase n=1 Tax=Elysia chlorotica TaxID=188477 RepID=A0A3S1A1U7_ELYCH|nr:hypothetical protein EGW08_000549 [Elysia chlorotica]
MPGELSKELPVLKLDDESARVSPVITAECQSKLDDLDKDLEEGDITLKGFWKKKCALLEGFLPAAGKTKMESLTAEFRDSKITEASYFKQLEEIMSSLLKSTIGKNTQTNGDSGSVAVIEEIDNGRRNGLSPALTSGKTSYGSANGHSSNSCTDDKIRNGSSNGHVGDTNTCEKSGNGSANGAIDSKHSCSSGQGEGSSNGLSNGRSIHPENKESEQSENGTHSNGSVTQSKDDVDQSENPMESDVMEISNVEDASSPPPAKKRRGRPSKGDSASNSAPKERRTPVRASRQLNSKSDGKQPSIMSMFGAKPKSEPKSEASSGCTDEEENDNENETKNSTDAKEEEMDECEENKPKRIKIQEEVEKKDKEGIVPAIAPSPAKPIPQRCTECLRYMDDPELKLFPGDPDTAVEEFIALTDPSLSLFTGEEDFDNMTDDRPQHKITNFSIYDKNTHLCAFDTGLIERNKYLFFSGVLKPIFDENPSPEGGVPCRNMGPINEWFISGFDGGENALIGFSTGYAEYILMEPSEAYRPFIEQMQLKVYMAKMVIEFVSDNEDASYEDLLNKIQITVPPQGLSGVVSFSEEYLLRHAQFIVDQVQSYDNAAADDESLLITTPCLRSLINLAGVTLGKRRNLRKDVGRAKVKKEKNVQTRATVTPLVRGLFDTIFQGQILDEDVKNKKRQRCGYCELFVTDFFTNFFCFVLWPNFTAFVPSIACARCPNLAIKSADDDELDEDADVEKEEVKPASGAEKKHKVAKNSKAKVAWVGEPTKKIGKTFYYGEVQVGDLKLRPGDCVSISQEDPKLPYFIARIHYLFETASGNKQAHIQWFYRGSETVLGEASDPLELFFVEECDDRDLVTVHDKVKVLHKGPPDDWSMRGGLEEEGSLLSAEDDDGKTFFFQKRYDPDLARFEDPPAVALEGFAETEVEAEPGAVNHCIICQIAADRERTNAVCLGEEQDSPEKPASGMVYYQSARKEGTEYRVGDCCYVNPDVIDFQIKHPKISNTKPTKASKLDEDVYPEAYRKGEYVKGSNDKCPEPFRVVRIVQIFTKKTVAKQDGVDVTDIKLRLSKFYRTENTHKGNQALYYTDLNKLYWSEEQVTLNFSELRGKCTVVYQDNLHQSINSYFLGGADRFYFSEAYNAESREFEEPPSHACLMGGKGKSKGKGKGKGKSSVKDTTANVSPLEEKVEVHRLRTLDVFAGCGGLSEGFHQAGMAESRWAIEKEEPAAQAFRLNNPGCTVFTDDCNLLLQRAMEGEETNAIGQKLPKKGDVELLCGGPPCQGFSGMNRFNSGDYSRFKNSLIASYLSYCDFYRPRFFLLENVRNFVSFKRSMVLKLTLRSLLRMGYQCTFGVLQAGSYGVAQTRRRAIILAAAPGEKLPYYPEPMHAFAPRAMQLSVVVDERKYFSNIKNMESTPYRTVTVRDIMSDLPEIKNGAKASEISYKGDAQTHFQRLIRCEQTQSLLREHICKEMNPLVAARMMHIPLVPGSDWRDLPNLELRLSDGTKTKKLIYSHHDKRNGRGSNGQRRGVCSCAMGKPCDPMDRQFNTLVPWCLPHTGNRHNHWAGLYGRLDWDGFFSTTVTNPEPMGKQGRVLHPEQHRVVSVRECARSQGFPDSYRFFGTILDKHRQIGNAVPPPMGRAIGLEIRKSLVWKDQEEKSKSSIAVTSDSKTCEADMTER